MMAAHRKCGRMGRIIAMITLTLSYFIVEIVVGHITGSIALVADSFHMLSDVVALIVGLAAVRISKMNSPKSTFGWVRAEVLGALVNSVFLLALCFTIFVDSVQRLVQTEDVENPKLLLIVGSVGLGINLVGLAIFHDHSHGHSHGGGGHSHGSKERKSLLSTSVAAAHEQHQQTGSNTVAITVLKDEVNDDEDDEEGSRDLWGYGEDQSADSSNNTSYRQLNVDRPADPAVADKMSAAGAGIDNSESKREHSHDNKKHSHDHKKAQSSSQLNMRGIFLHVFGDALGSVVVIVSALLIWLVPDPEGEDRIIWKPYIDPALSLVLVAIIIGTTVPLLKESALILLQAVPTQLSIREMKQALEKMEGVLAVHELHVWQLAGSRHVASLHLSVVSLEDYIRLSSTIKNYFHDNGVHSVTIQPEFDEFHIKKEGRDCALECGPEKSCYTDTCCGKKMTLSGTTTAAVPQNLLQLIEPVEARTLARDGLSSQGLAPPVVTSTASASHLLDGVHPASQTLGAMPVSASAPTFDARTAHGQEDTRLAGHAAVLPISTVSTTQKDGN